MYDIRQFKPVLYVLVALGISGFALAAQAPGLWVLSIGVLAINAWLIKSGRFTPIPRWMANLLTVLALFVLATPLRNDPSRAVFIIGEFLVALQLVKLYEQRANRDYAQLLILSLLLMVAASINTASLLFGLMLIAYLFLSLFCCLLFHLKVETDFAKAAIGLPATDTNPATLRHDQRHFTRSMRRLTVAVAAAAITSAIAVFLLFPRGAGAGLLGPLQIKPNQSLSGFSDVVSFERIAQITQNSAEVAWVKVLDQGNVVHGIKPLLLRGVALNVYTGDDDRLGAPRTWKRRTDESYRDVNNPRIPLRIDTRGPILRQQITLKQNGTPYLFAMPGLVRLDRIDPQMVPHYWPRDEVLESPDAVPQVTYTVESNGHVMNDSVSEWRMLAGPSSNDGDAPATSAIPPEIESYARRPEVSGRNAAGPLAAQRVASRSVDPLDPIIAQNICSYLQTNFTYTLDLTDAKQIGDRDPLVAFLYDFKRGHCEYFAGSMALMCQSLGMQARVVVGFKCDEYNSMLDQYIVRQSHAHAWVEVLDPHGEWLTFDPTSGRGADTMHSSAGMWHKTLQFVEYLQYTWANSVVAYDSQARSSLITQVDHSLNVSTRKSGSAVGRMQQWLDDHVDLFASRASVVLIAIMVACVIGAVVFFLLERWRIRRRARRIGLDELPASDQARLLRQLGFYDELLTLLENHRIVRPHHLTPLEFSRSIDFLPHDVFDAVRRLTMIFYRVRYGRHELSDGQQRHLSAAINKIAAVLGRPS